MAFQMIHMEVAYRLLKHWKWVGYPAEFMVGSVTPDSVHMRDDFRTEMKVRSHLFEDCGPWGDTQDYEHWLENIRAFWEQCGKKCRDEKTKCYAAAICVHCLTDYCNDLYIWRHFQKQNIPPMSPGEFKESFYVEARGIDLWLYQNSEHTKEIVPLLEQGECMELGGFLDAKDIKKTKEHLLGEQYDKPLERTEGYRYLSEDFLGEFLDNTVQMVECFFEES